MSYDVDWSGGADGDSWSRDFTYHARPAALWVGSIGRAEITFALSRATIDSLVQGLSAVDKSYAEIAPPGYEVDSTGVHWRFASWEPTEDCRITYGEHD